MQKKLEKVSGTKLFDEIEMPLIPVLARMEQAGIALDVPFFEKMSVELHDGLADLEKKIIECSRLRISTSIPPNSFRKCCSKRSSLTRPTARAKPPAGISPPRRMC